jgi:hypothetical protein
VSKSKTKADIIMARAVKYGLVAYRNAPLEPVEPEDCTGFPTYDDPLTQRDIGEDLRQRLYQDMVKHFDADPEVMLGVDMAVTGGDTTVYGRTVYDPEINQALQPEQTMKLYQWNSKLLQAYGDGDIIVMAMNVEEARDKVWSQFDPLKEGNPFEDSYLQLLRYTGDSDYIYIEEYRKKQNALREDLDKQPMQPVTDVICIRGSD